MADAPKGPSTAQEALWIVGGLVVLVALWWAAGGPGKTDLRGLFLAPSQPLGSGGAYGPQIGSSTEQVPAPEQDNSYTPPQY
jgi:hypothetical protein